MVNGSGIGRYAPVGRERVCKVRFRLYTGSLFFISGLILIIISYY